MRFYIKYKIFFLIILISLLTYPASAQDTDKTLKAAYLLGNSIQGMIDNNLIGELQAAKITHTIASIAPSNLEFMGLKCVSEIQSENVPFCKKTLNFMLETGGTANESICKFRDILSSGDINFRCGSGWRWD